MRFWITFVQMFNYVENRVNGTYMYLAFSMYEIVFYMKIFKEKSDVYNIGIV